MHVYPISAPAAAAAGAAAAALSARQSHPDQARTVPERVPNAFTIKAPEEKRVPDGLIMRPRRGGRCVSNSFFR